MIFVGMDVHDKRTTFCFLDPSLPEKVQCRWVTQPTCAASFRKVLGPLKGQCKVAYEVGTQAQWVAAQVRPLAVEVQVANPSQITWLYRSGRKNDRLDAKKLATLLYLGQLPRVHLPSADVSAWRALINHRRSMVKRRTSLKLQIRTILRSFARHCPHKSCWTRAGRQWLSEQQFDAVRDLLMKMLLADIQLLDNRLAEVEAQLDQIAAGNPQVALLRSIPGIGPRTSEAVVAFADDIQRFSRSKQFASYFGMTPTLDASAGVCRHGHISKRGPSVVRWVLVEAVHQVIRRCPAMRRFFDRIHRDRKDRYKKAVVAVGRKLLTIMCAMLRSNTRFDAERVFRPAPMQS